MYAEQQRAVVASLPSVEDGGFFETQPVGEADVDLAAMDADEGELDLSHIKHFSQKTVVNS